MTTLNSIRQEYAVRRLVLFSRLVHHDACVRPVCHIERIALLLLTLLLLYRLHCQVDRTLCWLSASRIFRTQRNTCV